MILRVIYIALIIDYECVEHIFQIVAGLHVNEYFYLERSRKLRPVTA